MKRTIALTALFLSALSAFALPGPDFRGTYVAAELKAIEGEYGTRNLADLKVNEVLPVAGRLDVARQKDGLVMIAGGLSLAWPGAGQFAVGDWTGGILHTGLQVGITAGTLFWAHSLLPSDLRFDNLDYVNATDDAIERAWKSHSAREFFPAIGALAAGGVVDFVLRVWSAKDAQSSAREQIDEGAIVFEPRYFGGHMGWGMRY